MAEGSRLTDRTLITDRTLREKVAERRAEDAADKTIDWVTISEAIQIALPILFETHFLGLENEHDKIVLEQGGAPDLEGVLRLRQQRDAQSKWTLRWIQKRGHVDERLRLVRRLTLEKDLAEYAKHKSRVGNHWQDGRSEAAALSAETQHTLHSRSPPRRPRRNATRPIKGHWTLARDRAIEWLEAEGAPAERGDLAKLEGVIQDFLATKDRHPAKSTIRDYAKRWIEEFKGSRRSL
jgi:hypothetical protein